MQQLNKLTELIEKYLNGELTKAEHQEFERRLETDADFAREVLMHINIDKALSEVDVIELRKKMTDINGELKLHRKFRHELFSAKWQYLAVAASITLIVTFGAKYINNGPVSNETLISKYYTPYEAEGISRSAQSQTEKLLSDALVSYSNKDYESAVNKFLAYFQLDYTNIQAHFYYAISCFETNRISEAKKSFQLVIDHQNNLYVEQAKWYLGLCYLKTFETNQALAVFTEIVNEDSTYSEKAKEIIRKLK